MCKKGSVNHQSLLKQMLFFLLIYYALLLVIKYPSKMLFKGTMTPSLLANSPEYWGKSYSSVVYLNLLFSCQIICTLGGSRKQLCLLQTKGVTLILSWVTALNSGIWGMHPVAQDLSSLHWCGTQCVEWTLQACSPVDCTDSIFSQGRSLDVGFCSGSC